MWTIKTFLLQKIRSKTNEKTTFSGQHTTPHLIKFMVAMVRGPWLQIFFIHLFVAKIHYHTSKHILSRLISVLLLSHWNYSYKQINVTAPKLMWTKKICSRNAHSREVLNLWKQTVSIHQFKVMTISCHMIDRDQFRRTPIFALLFCMCVCVKWNDKTKSKLWTHSTESLKSKLNNWEVINKPNK